MACTGLVKGTLPARKPAQLGPPASPKAPAGSRQGRVKTGAIQVVAPAWTTSSGLPRAAA